MNMLIRTYIFARFRWVAALWLMWSIFSMSPLAEDRARAPENALEHLSLYPGLEATLFASEPLIASVTNLDVDDRGRVWVVEVQNYRAHGARNQRPNGDRILILEDTDGDGEADHSKVFYQGHDVDAALGLCVFDGRVIVTCAPNVILFTDDDGDDVPDSKTYLFSETGQEQNDHSTHSFVFGPDGRLYWNMGNAGGWVHDRDGRQVYDQFGNPVFDRRVSRWKKQYRSKTSPFYGGMVFRCDLEGGQFEVLAHNFRNNYEVTVDSFGRMWQSDNDDDGNYGVRLNYVMEYGNYGYLDEVTGASWRTPRVSAHRDLSRRHWHQNDPGVVPNFVYTGAGSPTGICVYEGELLPEIFHGQVLHCDAGPGVLWAAMAQNKGAGYEGDIVRLVESKTDRWFRPVDVAIAPDGALFLSDWYDPVVGWNRQADLPRGRIFRIAPENVRYEVPSFEFATAAGAVEALRNANYSVRARAWLRLRDMADDATQSLIGLSRDPNPRLRARAYWLLAANAGSWERMMESALTDSEPQVRALVLRAASRFGHPLIPVIERLLDDDSALVRGECAVSLHRLPVDLAVPLWACLAEQLDADDRWYLEALGIGAEGRWDECLNALLGGAENSYASASLRRILWRSRSVATPLHLSRMLRYSELPPGEINGLLRAFDFQEPSEHKTRQLLTLLESEDLAGSQQDHELIRVEVLRRLASSGDMTSRSIRMRALSIAETIADPFRQIALAREFGLHEMVDVLVSWASAEAPELATEAMHALFALGKSERVSELLLAEGQRAEEIVSALAGVRSGPAVPILLSVLKSGSHSRTVREIALRALVDDRAGVAEIFRLARQGGFPDELREAAGKAFSQSLHVINRNLASELFPVPSLGNSQPLPGMTELLVYVGDVENGRKVFERATCSQCHVTGDLGQSYGPDLSGIGAKLAKQGIYEAILDPDASVSPSYRGVEIMLSNGDRRDGLLVSESEDSIVIRERGKGDERLQRSDIATIRKSVRSVMPSGLQELMSLNDLVDLVEFLAQARD